MLISKILLYYFIQSTILCSLVMISFFRHHSLKQCQGLLVTFFRIFVKFLYSQLNKSFILSILTDTYGQARSSIPRNMPLMNSSFESLNPWCIDATSVKFKYTFLHSWLAVNFYNNISVFVQIQISFSGQNCFEDIHNKFKETEPVEIS